MSEIGSQEHDDFVRGFHGIPDAAELGRMTFAELASLLSSCERESPKFHVVEREMKRRLAQDQAQINRPNMVYAACVGGCFSLAGVMLGYYLKNDVPPSSAMHQVEKGNLAIKPQSAQPEQGATSSIAKPPPKPEPVGKNADPRK